eukprot:TRINITY_DN7378_c0_g1_i1.p2 TRINITY_DN7378_c0_g1~~TRINITY_DN7378_c0_g1_i1.p2  ORF type:complete len:146 (+),score=48.08 TRINITY_DN7378_c0_g1_i1:144-581(+)
MIGKGFATMLTFFCVLLVGMQEQLASCHRLEKDKVRATQKSAKKSVQKSVQKSVLAVDSKADTMEQEGSELTGEAKLVGKEEVRKVKEMLEEEVMADPEKEKTDNEKKDKEDKGKKEEKSGARGDGLSPAVLASLFLGGLAASAQ